VTQYHYRLLNVFAIEGHRLSGNPLCVFEDARGLDDETMQALALQFNLSETTFILPSSKASARVRIFTPTLGTAQVVQELSGTSNAVTLEMHAGIIPVTHHDHAWTLRTNSPTWRPGEANATQLAKMLGVDDSDVLSPALWVNTGSEQLIVPLRNHDAVMRCRPDLALLRKYASLGELRFLVYVWAPGDTQQITSRFFFAKGTAVVEDPATGSACANLGGWLLATEVTLPVSWQISQGSAVARPSQLGLHVDGTGEIFVSGQVIELGRGVVEL
jgi:trans-2,3-dihydro-3-hydroxyanthranilate isomerase